jgi:RNA polymerase-binding transcription factor DksA
MTNPNIVPDEAAARLSEEEQRLLRDLIDIADEDPNHPGTYLPKPPEVESKTDDDSSIDATTAADAAVIIERLQEELRDVKKAQESLAAGTYGLCKYCHNPIDPKRLEARPASSSCVSCKKTLTQEA